MIYTSDEYKKGEKRKIKTEVCVIGSGCGGSMVAKELALSGAKVLVLEEGMYIPPESFNQRDDDMLPKLYRLAGMQMTTSYLINVLEGKCVGGGSVINAADCVMTHKEVFKMWQNNYGLKIEWSEIEECAKEVEEEIRVSKIEETELNRNNRTLLDMCRKKGFSADTFYTNRINCVECGYCMIGCRYNAKQSALITFLKEATKKGTEIYSSAFVKSLKARGKKVIIAEGMFLDPHTSRVKGRFEVHADVFFLSAGAIHTPNIVFNSNLSVPDNVGKNLSLQPQTPVVGIFEEEMVSYRGIPQAVFCNEFEEVDKENGYSGFRIEAIMVGPGMSSQFIPGIGKDTHRLMKQYRNVGAVLVLFPDKPSGYLKRWHTPQPEISYTLKDEIKTRMKKGIKTAAEIFLDNGAKEVAIPFEKGFTIKRKKELSLIDKIDIEKALVKCVSAHPQGTMRMSEREDGVISSDFKVKGLENLYVVDSSVFPTTSSSHIMMPIYAFAKLAVKKFLKQL